MTHNCGAGCRDSIQMANCSVFSNLEDENQHREPHPSVRDVRAVLRRRTRRCDLSPEGRVHQKQTSFTCGWIASDRRNAASRILQRTRWTYRKGRSGAGCGAIACAPSNASGSRSTPRRLDEWKSSATQAGCAQSRCFPGDGGPHGTRVSLAPLRQSCTIRSADVGNPYAIR